jgi:hypothetical protein
MVEFNVLQNVCEAAPVGAFTNAGSVTITVVLDVHPFTSVTVYECVPAETVYVPIPVYGVVPPVAVTVTTAVPPKQEILVADELAVNAEGSVMVVEVTVIHRFASYTVYACGPAVTL